MAGGVRKHAYYKKRVSGRLNDREEPDRGGE